MLRALKPLGMTAMRYPGGNFVSGYDWMDGVGPKENRPVVRDLAWQSFESNQFGTDEFAKMCEVMDWTGMIAVNLGTGTPMEARNWLEYCNCKEGTKYADMRVANGSKEPHGFKLWCLGNEMDGQWQIGHVPARDYAIRAQQAAKMMRDVDKSIKLVVCGSCTVDSKTYMEWDREVLEYTHQFVDYVSLHRYAANKTDDTADFLAIGNSIDKQIEEMDSVCKYVQAKCHAEKQVLLCFDEWNVWYKNMEIDGEDKAAPHLLEEVYNLEDALVVAGFLNSFIRHADIVKIATIAQVVNVIAPVMTRGDDLLIQSIYYPFAMISKRRDGVSLQPVVKGPCYESKSHGEAKYIDVSAILNENSLSVFLVNRHLTESAYVTIDIADKKITGLKDAEVVTGPDAKAANSFEQGDVVKAEPFADISVDGNTARLKLWPLSFVAATFEIK